MSETKTLVIDMKDGYAVTLNGIRFEDGYLEQPWIRKVEIPKNSTYWYYQKYTRVLFYVVDGRIHPMHIK